MVRANLTWLPRELSYSFVKNPVTRAVCSPISYHSSTRSQRSARFAISIRLPANGGSLLARGVAIRCSLLFAMQSFPPIPVSIRHISILRMHEAIGVC